MPYRKEKHTTSECFYPYYTLLLKLIKNSINSLTRARTGFASLSNEEIFDILKHLNLIDRMSFAMTSHRHKTIVHGTVLHFVMQLLRRFTFQTMAFLQLLWLNNAIIGGSIALAALYIDEEPRPDLKLHLFIPAFDNKDFIETLTDEYDYEIIEVRRIKARHFIESSVKKIIHLRNANHATIYVFFSRDDSALTPIFHLPATHHMNFISAYGIYCAYPHFTFAKDTILHPKAVYNTKTNEDVGQMMERYISDGLNVYTSFKSLSVDQPHDRCRLDIRCPHLIRTLYDKHGFFVPLELPITTILRPNKVAYNCENGVVWNIGGEGCESGMTPNDSFVMTTWLHGSKHTSYNDNRLQ